MLEKRISDRVEEILTERPAYGGFLRFFGRVLVLMIEEEERIREEGLISETPELGSGFPLLKPSDFSVHEKSCRCVLKGLAAIDTGGNEHAARELQKLECYEAEVGLDVLRLAGLYLEKDNEALLREADAIEVDAGILTFALSVGVRPSVESQRRLIEPFIKNDKNDRLCPVCGSLPLLLELSGREGKTRRSICSSCGQRWPAPRIGCAFCGASDHDALHYLVAEGQESIRLDFCDECGRYIKTLDGMDAADESDFLLPLFLLEDLGSLHLDLIAKGKGYLKGAPDPWGMIA